LSARVTGGINAAYPRSAEAGSWDTAFRLRRRGAACAYVVRREGAEVTEAELIDYTHDRLAAYKRPRRVVFLSCLPTTSTGKIMRRKLADAPPAQT